MVPPWFHRGAAGVPHAVPGPAALAAGARLPGGLAPGLRQVRAAGDGDGPRGPGDGLGMDLGVLEMNFTMENNDNFTIENIRR